MEETLQEDINALINSVLNLLNRGSDSSENLNRARVRETDSVLLSGLENQQEIERLLSQNSGKNTIVLRNRYLDNRFIERIIACANGRPYQICFEIRDERNVSCIFDEVQTAKLYENISLLEQNGIKTYFFSKPYNYRYETDKVLEANRMLQGWAKKINSLEVDGKKLSPKEKYLLAYVTLCNFFKYKSEPAKTSTIESRGTVNVLTGDKIVCVGFANVLSELLNLIGIPAMPISLKLKNGDYFHASCLVYIDDKKYGEKGFIYCDPTYGGLLYSFVPLKDIDKLFLRGVDFVDYSSRGDAPYKLEKFISRCLDISLEDKEILEKCLKLKLEHKQEFSEIKHGDASFISLSYQVYIKKILHGIDLSEDEQRRVSYLFGYNDMNKFKQDVLRISFKFKDCSLDDVIFKTSKFLAENSRLYFAFRDYKNNNELKNLGGNVSFSEETLEVVLRALGVSKRLTKKYKSAFILDELCQCLHQAEKDEISFELNLDSDNNYFTSRLKKVNRGEDREFDSSQILTPDELRLARDYSANQDDLIFRAYFANENGSKLVHKIKGHAKVKTTLKNLTKLCHYFIADSFKGVEQGQEK